MDSLSNLIRDLVLNFFINPKLVLENKIDIYFLQKLETKPEITRFLLGLITITFILPISIVFRDFGLKTLLIYSSCYLLIFFLAIIITSGVMDAIKVSTIKRELHFDWKPLKLNTFKKKSELKLLISNLITKNVLDANQNDLLLVLTNSAPNSKINILFKGGSGVVSYHGVFFLLAYMIEGNIENLEKNNELEILNYIQSNFLKAGKEIDFKLLQQSYNDWLKKKYSSQNLEFFINTYLCED